MSTPTAGARPDEVRRHNRTALLRRLHVDGPCTRAELATELGLNRSTIKALVDGLAESGIVQERVPRVRARPLGRGSDSRAEAAPDGTAGSPKYNPVLRDDPAAPPGTTSITTLAAATQQTRPKSGAGRPSLLVLPQPQAAVVLAVDIRVEQVAIALVGLGGEMLARNRWNLHGRANEPDEVITHVVESTRVLAEELDLKPMGIGVSVPGVVRRSDGFVHEAPNLRWRDVPLGERLGSILGLPIRVANDAEMGALAEHLRGTARDTLDAVYVSADVGIGGGVLADGAILRGTAGYVGELGHMIVNPAGLDCHCGNRGCWETEVGEVALSRALSLPEGSPRGAVVAELRALDPRPVETAERLGAFRESLASGLVTIVNVFSPKVVVLGDLFTALPSAFVAEIGADVSRRSLVSRAIGGTRVVTSALGADGKLIGAAELAFEPVLEVL